jgi:uncharacterized YceG family protein
VFAVGAVYYGVRSVLPDSSKPTADPHGPMLSVVIPRGATAVTIGDLLEQRGIVSDGTRFRNYVKAQGEGTDFHPGGYRFQAGTDYDVIISHLNRGPVHRLVKLVIPEGYRISQIEDSLKAVGISPKAYRTALARTKPPAGWGATSMEGFMFPATYTIKPHEKPETLIAQQLAAFQNAFSQVDMKYARSKNLTDYDVLKIASMIEREAGSPSDRPKIAAVIYNRLHLGMNLGIDATLLYEYGSWTHQLTDSELHADTPYNTRVRPGLPPTPISNPGLASLQAAAHPAAVDYLYYVAHNGQTYFTNNYNDFVAHGG